MVRLVANINGAEVFSNKTLDRVANGVVYFTDGSSCDGNTGKIYNKGPGDISFRGTIVDSNLVVTEPIKFLSDTVDLRSFSGDVDVQVYGGKEIELVMEGTKDNLDNIKATKSSDSLIIEAIDKVKSSNFQSETFSKSNVSVSHSSNSSGIGFIQSLFGSIRSLLTSKSTTSFSSSSLTVSTNRNSTKVRIKVPKRTALIIKDIKGDVVIADTEGSLNAKLSGSNQISAGSIGDTDVSINGSGDFKAKHINGSFNLKVAGSGRTIVNDGQVSLLKVILQGSGDVHFKGRAIDAQLNSSGSGHIKVKYVKNHPLINQRGSGNVKIGNRNDS